jgi:deoxycytidylate deaminase
MEVEQFDIDYIIARMQDAVDIVNSSEHETSKVAACLFDASGTTHHMIARTNHRPKALFNEFDTYDRIGKSSQFVHAEAACVLEYPYSTKDHYLCVTDPFCPNCAKTIIESGVSRVFIDHKGMDKDFVRRRAGAFNLISMKMAQAAGIDVYILYRKERRFEPLVLKNDAPKPKFGGFSFHEMGEAEATINAQSDVLELQTYLASFASEALKTKDADVPRVFAFVTDRNDDMKILEIEERLTPGVVEAEVLSTQPEDTDKYRFAVDAMNRLYCALKRLDLKLVKGIVCSSHIPSSRAFVNAMLTDVKILNLHSLRPSHDEQATEVCELFENKGFMSIDQN